MKRIVLCFDGTWNIPADDGVADNDRVETNISRFHRSVLPEGADGVKQRSWYSKGVGTDGWDKVWGGLLGAGLDRHIIDGYTHLVNTYEKGDQVYILGFSRGAYTARSLVGMIRNCGLVWPNMADLKIPMARALYRSRGMGPKSFAAKFFQRSFSRMIPIRFLGVWDTVGALGIPLTMAKKLNSALYQFHDTELSSIVESAHHAVALDEHRADYNATLWEPKEKPGQTVEQRWFVGAHADVGGGYADRRLSDLTLAWMSDRAAAAGLSLAPIAVDPENYKAPLNDSYAAFLKGLYAKLHPRYLRTVLGTEFGNEFIDPTVDQRRSLADLLYSPRNPGLPALVNATV